MYSFTQEEAVVLRKLDLESADDTLICELTSYDDAPILHHTNNYVNYNLEKDRLLTCGIDRRQT